MIWRCCLRGCGVRRHRIGIDGRPQAENPDFGVAGESVEGNACAVAIDIVQEVVVALIRILRVYEVRTANPVRPGLLDCESGLIRDADSDVGFPTEVSQFEQP